MQGFSSEERQRERSSNMGYVSKDDVRQMLHNIGGCDAEKESWADGWDKAIDEAIRQLDHELQDGELKAICKFAEEEDFSFDICIQQLRSLWTAFCLHSDYECDTRRYDTDLREVWEAVKRNESNPWKDDAHSEEAWFDSFDSFMCEEIVAFTVRIPPPTPFCDICGFVMDWEEHNYIHGDLWSCEQCGITFCTKCAVDRIGRNAFDEMIRSGEHVLCPDCEQKCEADDQQKLGTK